MSKTWKNVNANYKSTNGKVLIENSFEIVNKTIVTYGQGINIDRFTFNVILMTLFLMMVLVNMK